MRICVGICTWNRARLLEQTLSRMEQLRVPSGLDWEIVVVNNNCTDATDQVVEKFCQRLPLRGIHELRQGRSHALNAAIEATNSDWILWTDDDVLVSPDWLNGHLRGIREFGDAGFFGGCIEAHFEVPPPDWLVDGLRYVETAFGVRQFGPQPFKLSEKVLPYGANFAIRTDVQKKYRFDTELGRVGSSMVGGEETAMALQLLRDGHVGYWNPYAKLKHVVPPERMTLDYLRRYYFGIGQTAVRMGGIPQSPRVAQLKFLASAAISEVEYRALRVLSTSRWVRSMTRASNRWGRAAATRSICSEGARKAA